MKEQIITAGNCMTHKAYIGIGSNLGRRAYFIRQSLCGLEKIGRIKHISRATRTSPWGVTDQPRFINIVLLLITELSPQDLLQKCLDLEIKIGRVRDRHWGPRTIDIDILFYDNKIIDMPSLKIPHPYISERLFVLGPLCEIAPDLRHPKNGLSVKEMADRLLGDS